MPLYDYPPEAWRRYNDAQRMVRPSALLTALALVVGYATKPTFRTMHRSWPWFALIALLLLASLAFFVRYLLAMCSAVKYAHANRRRRPRRRRDLG